MADTIKFFSQNCQGLNDTKKRRDVFQYIRKKKYNIACLQDIHVSMKMETYVKAEWGQNAFFSTYTSNSRGICILFDKCDFKVHRIKSDVSGNYIILDLTIQDKRVTLVSIYGPNSDQPSFYQNLKIKIQEFENDMVLICGDWNLVLEPTKDLENYANINNPKARETVLKMIEELNLIDIWRIMHENDKCFTWRKKNPRKQARLDFFLMSDNLTYLTWNTSIVPGYRTDHSGIVVELNFNNIEKGKGYWKFNNSLLKEKNYIKKVKNTIEEVKNTYKINRNQENNNNEPVIEEQYSINDQLFLETLLLMIRGETIKYSSIRKKRNTEKENKLENEIKILEEDINKNFISMDQEKIDLFEQKKSELYEMRKEKIDGVMLRSRSRYYDLGEKPTNYFFNLENRNFTNKTMTKLINDSGNEITQVQNILAEQKRFYENLYSVNVNLNDIDIETEIGENEAKLENDTAQKLEGEISLSELSNALKGMKNGKSPGLDGFTVEFFKFFGRI